MNPLDLGELVADASGQVCTLEGRVLLSGDPEYAEAIVLGFNAWHRRQLAIADDEARGPYCLCPATSEYDPPCPRHGVLGIGVRGGP